MLCRLVTQGREVSDGILEEAKELIVQVPSLDSVCWMFEMGQPSSPGHVPFSSNGLLESMTPSTNNESTLQRAQSVVLPNGVQNLPSLLRLSLASLPGSP